MSAPHLPKVQPAVRPVGPARVRVGRVGPRLMLRGVLVGLALLLLVVLLAGCGGAALPAALPSSAPPAGTTAPAPSTTTSPTSSAPATGSGDTSTTPTGEGTTDRPAPAPQARPTPAAPTTRPGAAARPIWPATDTASARTLQQRADRGGEPWLLDPEEVAISYVGVERGYRDPQVVVLAPGRIDVRDGATPAQVLVELAQPVRSGPGGIWAVTGATRH